MVIRSVPRFWLCTPLVLAPRNGVPREAIERWHQVVLWYNPHTDHDLLFVTLSSNLGISSYRPSLLVHEGPPLYPLVLRSTRVWVHRGSIALGLLLEPRLAMYCVLSLHIYMYIYTPDSCTNFVYPLLLKRGREWVKGSHGCLSRS